MSTPIGKLLADLGKIDADAIKRQNLRIGQIAITPNGEKKIFSVIIKNRYFDPGQTVNISRGLENLKAILTSTDVKSFRISRSGDHTDVLPRGKLLELLHVIFEKSGIAVTICYGKLKSPPIENRGQIIREFHESLIGGHRGVTKTYRKVRERFYWPSLRKEIQDFIRRCVGCQEQKLVRAKTREPMLLTETPADTFDKVSLDTVGPLPTTPHGNKHM